MESDLAGRCFRAVEIARAATSTPVGASAQIDATEKTATLSGLSPIGSITPATGGRRRSRTRKRRRTKRRGRDGEEVSGNRVSSLAKRAAVASKSTLSPGCEGSSPVVLLVWCPPLTSVTPSQLLLDAAENSRERERESGKMTRLPYSLTLCVCVRGCVSCSCFHVALSNQLTMARMNAASARARARV